jgi:hypothetical protein
LQPGDGAKTLFELQYHICSKQIRYFFGSNLVRKRVRKNYKFQPRRRMYVVNHYFPTGAIRTRQIRTSPIRTKSFGPPRMVFSSYHQSIKVSGKDFSSSDFDPIFMSKSNFSIVHTKRCLALKACDWKLDDLIQYNTYNTTIQYNKTIHMHLHMYNTSYATIQHVQLIPTYNNTIQHIHIYVGTATQ